MTELHTQSFWPNSLPLFKISFFLSSFFFFFFCPSASVDSWKWEDGKALSLIFFFFPLFFSSAQSTNLLHSIYLIMSSLPIFLLFLLRFHTNRGQGKMMVLIQGGSLPFFVMSNYQTIMLSSMAQSFPLLCRQLVFKAMENEIPVLLYLWLNQYSGKLALAS